MSSSSANVPQAEAVIPDDILALRELGVSAIRDARRKHRADALKEIQRQPLLPGQKPKLRLPPHWRDPFQDECDRLLTSNDIPLAHARNPRARKATTKAAEARILEDEGGGQQVEMDIDGFSDSMSMTSTSWDGEANATLVRSAEEMDQDAPPAAMGDIHTTQTAMATPTGPPVAPGPSTVPATSFLSPMATASAAADRPTGPAATAALFFHSAAVAPSHLPPDVPTMPLADHAAAPASAVPPQPCPAPPPAAAAPPAVHAAPPSQPPAGPAASAAPPAGVVEAQSDLEDDEGPPAHCRPGPLYGSALAEVVAYGDEVRRRIATLAAKHHVSKLTILNGIGLGGTPEKRAESLWNQWQTVYWDELKEHVRAERPGDDTQSEGEEESSFPLSAREHSQRCQDVYREHIRYQKATLSAEDVDAINAWKADVQKRHAALIAKRNADTILCGDVFREMMKLRKEFTTMGDRAAAIGIETMGLVVSTNPDPDSRNANYVWCGSQNALQFISKGKGPIERILTDFETGVRSTELRNRIDKGPFNEGKWKDMGKNGETRRHAVSMKLREILNIATESDFPKVPWGEWGKIMVRHGLVTVNWPEHVPFPGGNETQASIGKGSLCKRLFDGLVGTGVVPLIEIRPWTQEEKKLQEGSSDFDEIPVIVSDRGGVLLTVGRVDGQASERTKRTAERKRKKQKRSDRNGGEADDDEDDNEDDASMDSGTEGSSFNRPAAKGKGTARSNVTTKVHNSKKRPAINVDDDEDDNTPRQRGKVAPRMRAAGNVTLPRPVSPTPPFDGTWDPPDRTPTANFPSDFRPLTDARARHGSQPPAPLPLTLPPLMPPPTLPTLPPPTLPQQTLPRPTIMPQPDTATSYGAAAPVVLKSHGHVNPWATPGKRHANVYGRGGILPSSRNMWPQGQDVSGRVEHSGTIHPRDTFNPHEFGDVEGGGIAPEVTIRARTQESAGPELHQGPSRPWSSGGESEGSRPDSPASSLSSRAHSLGPQIMEGLEGTGVSEAQFMLLQQRGLARAVETQRSTAHMGGIQVSVDPRWVNPGAGQNTSQMTAGTGVLDYTLQGNDFNYMDWQQ